MRDDLNAEIDDFIPHEHTTEAGYTLAIGITAHFTLVDGKIFSLLTGTASSQCGVCGALPSGFNVRANLESDAFQPTENGLDHGCRPLHSWMRFLYHVLNLACNIPVRARKAKGDAAKELRQQKKREIQQKYLRFGLHIDFPAQHGCGSSTDGNTARRAFKDYQRLARITGVNVDLLKRLWYIALTFYSLMMTDFEVIFEIGSF